MRPTRGIDVGREKRDLQFDERLGRRGVGIPNGLLRSAGDPTIADRVYVMREGTIVKELNGSSTTQEEIITYATGRRIE